MSRTRCRTASSAGGGLRLVGAGLIGLALGTACAPPVPEIGPGVSWELAQFRSRTVRDVRYDIEFTVPIAVDEAIAGSMTVTLDLHERGVPVVFDFVESETRVHTVSVNGALANYRARDDHVMIPGGALRQGENTIDIAFVPGDLSLNRNTEFLYTLFVPDRARFAFPVFDQPNLKGRYTLTLRLPPTWTAVANGPEVERVASDTGVTIGFGETPPISSYLFAFAAGRFQADSALRGDRWLRMYHRETDLESVARNRDAIFDLHATALEWLEDYTEIAYPFGKFDFVLIPSFQYGGMEHPGAILYRASSLFLDEAATQNQLLGRASVIAHETAHMWFGDLVTMNWFDDVWTKEVFANFMAAKIVNPSFPEVDHELRFVLAHYPAAYAVDRTAGANPIRQPLENLVDAGSLYGAIIYQKAPVAMRHLEARIGADAFRDGLREYLATYQFGNASWPDLIAMLDARTPDDLDGWSRMWVEEAGRPRITTGLTLDTAGAIGALRLRQDDPAARGRLWPQRLAVVLSYPDSQRTFPVLLDSGHVTVAEASGLPAPRYVLPNGDGIAYGEFVPDSASLAYLLDHLPDQPDPMTRGVGWMTLWDAMLGGVVPPSAFVAVARRALDVETVELNLQQILGYLTAAYSRYLTESERDVIAVDLDAQLWRLANLSTHLTARTAFFRAYRSLMPTDRAVDRMLRIWRHDLTIPGLPLAERDYITLALQLAVREVPGWKAMLDEQGDRIENPDRGARFAFVREAVDADPAVRDAFFASLRDAGNREHELWVLEALGYLHHPLRQSASVRYIGPSLELVEEIQRTGDIFFPLGWINATLGGHNSSEAADIVRTFLADRPDYPPRLRGKILQAADGLYRSAVLIDAP